MIPLYCSIHNNPTTIIHSKSSTHNDPSTMINPQRSIHNYPPTMIHPQRSIHNDPSPSKLRYSYSVFIRWVHEHLAPCSSPFYYQMTHYQIWTCFFYLLISVDKVLPYRLPGRGLNPSDTCICAMFHPIMCFSMGIIPSATWCVYKICFNTIQCRLVMWVIGLFYGGGMTPSANKMMRWNIWKLEKIKKTRT